MEGISLNPRKTRARTLGDHFDTVCSKRPRRGARLAKQGNKSRSLSSECGGRPEEANQCRLDRCLEASKEVLKQSTSHSYSRKRPRQREDHEAHRFTEPRPAKKRRCKSVKSSNIREIGPNEPGNSTPEEELDPINYWRETGRWPNAYFEPCQDSMSHLLARQKSSSSLRRKQSFPTISATASDAPSSTTPSDQKPRDVKSAPYQDARYETLLATKGSFMDKAESGLQNESQQLCRTLLETEQAVPADSLFDAGRFEETCKRVRNRNEARVIQDISRLLVPSAESLVTRSAIHFRNLVESVNEGWNNSIPLTKTRPQPDYAVGFRREAFTDSQLKKLAPFIGEFLSGDQSFFMATYYMYFPFLTCEVKCGAAALDVADRQNAHSMTLAVRAVVELFRLVGREREIDRQILAFSAAHDHRSVRLYGHYPVISSKDTKFYRHPIRTFDFTELDGRDKWTMYKFVKSVYEVWSPIQFKRLTTAIEQIPSDIDFSVPPLPQDSGLSQSLEEQSLADSSQTAAINASSSEHASLEEQASTLNTSLTDAESLKRSRKRRTIEN